MAAAREITEESERLAEYAALEKADRAGRRSLGSPAVPHPICSCSVTGSPSYTPHWAGYSDFSFTAVDLV